ncbi:MAG TPA: outer membrane protein assembly factor BamE [Allosphingosinicella sp.]|jgi:outer membrane protein assembly factor BamE (lipoprotein component of BamABCDE complex)
MIVRHARSAVLIAAVAAGLLTSGCARIRDHQGYLADEALLASVQAGVDNKDSVLGTLGRPTFVGQFNQNDWYYVSRDTRNFAFSKPNPKEQTVLRVRFDEQGNVASVERRGIEQVVSIDPTNDKTPTLGRDKSFFEELFGNIGAVGSGIGGGPGRGQGGGGPNSP